ncbi:male sterility protein-domain-containing protein [Spinellus fusiger]|nr:male sterility protein-domain-containing protein [Spinellus fusiger]
METHPTTDYYTDKCVLITGATGFVGKAVLWKLIHSYGHVVDTVYLLLRSGGKGSPRGAKHRMHAEILNTKVWLTQVHGRHKAFQTMAHTKKLVAVACDVSAPDLGLSPENKLLVQRTHIVIHCAAAPEYGATLDWCIEMNALATLRVMDLADECPQMTAFVHMSMLHLYHYLPEGGVLECMYDLGLGDPEEILKSVMAMNEQESAAFLKRILQQFPNTHIFTKALAEHLIFRRIELNREEEKHGGKKQWPIAIVRPSWIGPAAEEPSPGWSSGWTGVNAWIALHGHGIPLVKPSQGDLLVNIVPVDYVAKVVLGCIPHLKFPGTDFTLPYAPTPLPRPPTLFFRRDSVLSEAGSPVVLLNMPKPDLQLFPPIYHVATRPAHSFAWKTVYGALQHYWMRTLEAPLLEAQDYFAAATPWSTARLMMGYYRKPALGKLKITGAGEKTLTRAQWMDLSVKVRHVLERELKVPHRYDTTQLMTLEEEFLVKEPMLDPRPFEGLGRQYLLQAVYGVHSSLFSPQKYSGLRSLCLHEDWECALYTAMTGIIDEQVTSVVYTEEEVRQRIQQMLDIVLLSLQEAATYQQKSDTLKPVWVECMNDRLEDWHEQGSESMARAQSSGELYQWSARRTDTSEVTKVIVLNDQRVGKAVMEVAQRSGIKQDKVVEQALRILSRMLERTQLSYVCFTGSFLTSFFRTMFSTILVRIKDIERIKQQIKGKSVVYIPVSKTTIDPLIVWYVCIRYHLPVPAMMVDEALAVLGPLSDLLRLSGTVFIKRDPSQRTSLATALTTAYTQHLLQEHGALLMLFEHVRSRTGLPQDMYRDGLLEILIGTYLETLKSVSTRKEGGEPISLAAKDIAFVPINIYYEVIPDLPKLVSQDLFGQQEPPVSSQFKPPSVSLPSETRAARTHQESVKVDPPKGRLLMGLGQVLCLSTVVEEQGSHVELDVLVKAIAQPIAEQQQQCLTVSPLSLVSAILLHSRSQGNVIRMEQMKQHLLWLRSEIKARGDASLDWDDNEDVETIIFYAIQLLDSRHKIVTVETREDVYFTLSNRAENVLQLAYYTNQIRNMFLKHSLFFVACLSFGSTPRTDSECWYRFEFLSKLMDKHATDPMERSSYDSLVTECKERGILAEAKDPTLWVLHITPDSDPVRYGYLTLIASLVYPSLDTLWVTLCSLSELQDMGYLPSAFFPQLTQWVGAHLTSGKRTLYYEVLSTDYIRQSLEGLVRGGLLARTNAKEVLSPDAQMLLQALGLPTNDEVFQLKAEEVLTPSPLIPNLVLSPAIEDCENDQPVPIECPDKPHDPVALLCHRIEKIRQDGAGGSSTTDRDKIYTRCQSQIRRLCKAQVTFSEKHAAGNITIAEDKMIQLGYSLTQNATNYHSWEDA